MAMTPDEFNKIADLGDTVRITFQPDRQPKTGDLIGRVVESPTSTYHSPRILDGQHKTWTPLLWHIDRVVRMPAADINALQINRFILEHPGGRLIGDRWKEDPIVPVAVGVAVTDFDREHYTDRVTMRLVLALDEMLGVKLEGLPDIQGMDPLVKRLEVPLIVAELIQWYIDADSWLWYFERLPGMVF